MGTDLHALPRTVQRLEAGIDRGEHVGVQLAVSLHGDLVADVALGLSASDRPMTSESMLQWFSMTKTVTALAALQLWERGLVGLNDPVVAHVPEFARGGPGKEAVTIRHLLTHTGGFRSADTGDALARSLDDNVAAACDAPLEEGWVPGEKAGYHATAGMNVLAEIVQRVDGRPFEEYVRAEVFEPLDMETCWIGMPADVAADLIDAGRIGVMHQRLPDGTWFRHAVSAAALQLVGPGGGGRGPMLELLHLFEALLGGGRWGEARVASPQTVEAMLARHRVGMLDHSIGFVVDWGLGIAVDVVQMGRHCSRRAAGHGGALSSVSFCDPVHRLAVACVCNGMVAENQARLEDVMTALYVDLGLAAPEAAGRDHRKLTGPT